MTNHDTAEGSAVQAQGQNEIPTMTEEPQDLEQPKTQSYKPKKRPGRKPKPKPDPKPQTQPAPVLVTAPAPIDKTPEQAFKDDWKINHRHLGLYITQKGKMRSGLKPSDQVQAREILKSYGFRL